jgi:hypothetical protein
LKISKKFAKFYVNRFRPITKYEDKDVQRSREAYRGFVLVGAIGCGFFSYMRRKGFYASTEYYNMPRDLNLLGALVNDLFCAAIGYVGAHLFCCDYIYKNRQYVIERLHYERSINFNRDQFDISVY